jgi:hypothetical protein
MKTAWLAAGIIFCMAVVSNAWICNDESVTKEVYHSFGPFEINMSSVSAAPAPVYDYSLDALVSDFDTETVNSADSSVELGIGYFNFSDFQGQALPQFLQWAHTPYFVNVPARSAVTFETIHLNALNSTVAPGYPKIVYWQTGNSQQTTLSLDYTGSSGSGNLYRKAVALPCGSYSYQYIIKTLQYADEYSLSLSSFVVCNEPCGFSNSGTADYAVTTNGKVRLQWQLLEPGTALTYRVYAGKDPAALQLVYEGAEPFCELLSLDYGSEYHWQVEAINEFGVSSRGRVNRFSTIERVAKAYNYPNPFDPASNELTNITFDMRSSGNAELSMYTETGYLCWRGSYSGLAAGNNQIVYDGRDGSGNLLYNGTYICVIRKNYDDGAASTMDKCRLLVIK